VDQEEKELFLRIEKKKTTTTIVVMDEQKKSYC
jgi:hypothetical protein